MFERYTLTTLSHRDLLINPLLISHLLHPDPENLLVMLQTWQSGDCSLQEPYNGNFEKAMSSIKAKTLVLPSKTDLYFP